MTTVRTYTTSLFQTCTSVEKCAQSAQVKQNSLSVLELHNVDEHSVTQWSDAARPYNFSIPEDQLQSQIAPRRFAGCGRAEAAIELSDIREACGLLQQNLQASGIEANCAIQCMTRRSVRTCSMEGVACSAQNNTVRILVTIFEKKAMRSLQEAYTGDFRLVPRSFQTLVGRLLVARNHSAVLPEGVFKLSRKAWRAVEQALGAGFLEQNICDDEIFGIEKRGRTVLPPHICVRRSGVPGIFDDEGFWIDEITLVSHGKLEQYLVSLRQASALSLIPSGGAIRGGTGEVEFAISAVRVETSRRLPDVVPAYTITDVTVLAVDYRDLSCLIDLSYQQGGNKFYWRGRVNLIKLLAASGHLIDGSLAVTNTGDIIPS